LAKNSKNRIKKKTIAMGSSLSIFGVNYKKLGEDYPGYFKNSQEVSIGELQHLFYESLYEKVYDEINCGLELFFENGIKRDCFTINVMMHYFFSSFSWDGEIELEHHGSHYKLTKSQVIDLIDWYIALTYVFTDYKDRTIAMKEPKYLEEAKMLIDYFKSNPDDENYFQISMYDFVALKEEVLNAHYDCYFYTYSF
jgi:hypothetical protein